MNIWKFALRAFVLVAALWVGPAVLAQHGHIVQNMQDVKWGEAPPFLPPGAKLAVVKGNPSEKAPFTIRVMLPANYKIPAHSHPADEHVVVLSGALYLGMRDKLDPEGGTKLTVGGFAMAPAGKNHYAYTREETILLVYGTGPDDFRYVNPADDPRNAKKK